MTVRYLEGVWKLPVHVIASEAKQSVVGKEIALSPTAPQKVADETAFATKPQACLRSLRRRFEVPSIPGKTGNGLLPTVSSNDTSSPLSKHPLDRGILTRP